VVWVLNEHRGLDLNKREKWVCVLPGTMHQQVWKGDTDTEADEEEEGSEEEDDEEDDDDNSSSSSSDDEGVRDNTVAAEGGGAASSKVRRSSNSSGAKGGSGGSGKSGTIRAEIAGLRDQLQVDDANRTPQLGEKLTDWFTRTTEYWTRLAFESHDASSSGGGALSEKEYRRLAFSMAQERYEEVRPILDRLNELEEQQREAEEAMRSKGGLGSRGKKDRR